MGVEPNWAGRRVLVTGNTGFKGSWLCLWLLQMGARVTGLALPPPTSPSLFALARLEDEIDQHYVDVRDHDKVKSVMATSHPEVVFHLAAQPLVRESFLDPVTTYTTNVMGTIHVLDAVRTEAPSVGVVINVTSDKCYLNREWEWGYREDDPMGGFDPYSNSKGCAELVTEAYRSSYFGHVHSPRLASVRAGNVIGGGDWAGDRLIPDLMRAAIDGKRLTLRRPDSVRPWQHVLNPVSGYIALATSLPRDASLATAFNFGPDSEDVWPVQSVCKAVAAAWPRALDWTIDTGPHPHEATFLHLDSSRARTRLDWRPTWGLPTGIQKTVDWYQSYANGDDMRDVTLRQLLEFWAEEGEARITPERSVKTGGPE